MFLWAMNVQASDGWDLEAIVSGGVTSLKKALTAYPEIKTARDHEQRTLLHHLACIGSKSRVTREQAEETIAFVFALGPHDFHAMDREGNTPVHLAAKTAHTLIGNEVVFPAFIKAAKENSFDFSRKNALGKTTLQIATMNPRIHLVRDIYESNARTVLTLAPDCAIDELSSTGGTALFYAINHQHNIEAALLLDHKANPLLGSDEDHSPLIMLGSVIAYLNKQLKIVKEYYKEPNDSCVVKFYENKIEAFKAIELRILELQAVNMPLR